jgi:hypothetical protein
VRLRSRRKFRLRASDAARIKKYVQERNEVLRALDPERFEAFWTRWEQPRPPGWWAHPVVPLIMMHKVRLHVEDMTEAEKAASREWLLSRGYDLDV